jgi:hypothetical protein
MTSQEMKEKTEYNRGKIKKIEQWLIKNKMPLNFSSVVTRANLNIIKKVLFDNGLISKEEFEYEYMKEDLAILENIKSNFEKQKMRSKLIVANTVPPKEFKKVNA